MYVFWFDYIKPVHQDRAKLCHMDAGGFVIYIKTEDFYLKIADNVEELFDTKNYTRDDDNPLLIG